MADDIKGSGSSGITEEFGLPEFMQVEVAGLSKEANEQVVEAVQDIQEDGGVVSAEDGYKLIQDAELAEDHRESAAAIQLEQAKAAESGDFDRAQELAVEAGYDLQAADDLGRESSTHVVEAQAEEMALGEAEWNQEIADDNATTAAAYAETGDMDTAAIYADTAADHGATALDYGDAGDHGGSYAAADTSAAVASPVADTSATE